MYDKLQLVAVSSNAKGAKVFAKGREENPLRAFAVNLSGLCVKNALRISNE